MTPTKTAYPLAEIRPAAEALRDLLAPACVRIEIAGSIRREAATCHDIEIIAMPIIEAAQVPATLDLFTGELAGTEEHEISALEALVASIGAHRGSFIPRESGGRMAWGPKYKRAWFFHGERSYPVDLFAVTPPAQWGAVLAIRTGPADLSHKLVTPRTLGGYMPWSYREKQGALWRMTGLSEPVDVAIDTPEEADYFAALGLECPPAANRTLATLKRLEV